MIKLLLVEDEEKIRNGIKSVINWNDLGVSLYCEASNGYEALNLIYNEAPDIVLTDIKMPVMDGLQLIEKLGKELPKIKSVIMSGYDDFDYIQKAIKLGVSDYILKPSGAHEIQNVIEKVKKQIFEEREREIQLQNLMEKCICFGIGKNHEAIYSEKSISIVLRNAIKFIEDNYYKDLNRKNVAQEVYITPSYLSILFKKEMGISFVDYLHKIRIQRACELLHDIRYKIYDVAVAVGYNDEKYFFQVFKKYKGMTPMQYRNNFFGT